MTTLLQTFIILSIIFSAITIAIIVRGMFFKKTH